jgi:hypothetical protein
VSALLTGIAALGWNGRRDKAVLPAPKPRRAKGRMQQATAQELPRIPREGNRMLDFVQQVVSGIALGCVYGLIALGFVLVYKATEVVNFAPSSAFWA